MNLKTKCIQSRATANGSMTSGVLIGIGPQSILMLAVRDRAAQHGEMLHTAWGTTTITIGVVRLQMVPVDLVDSKTKHMQCLVPANGSMDSGVSIGIVPRSNRTLA